MCVYVFIELQNTISKLNLKIIAYILSIIAVVYDKVINSQKKKNKLAKSSKICEMNDFIYFSKNSKN